MSGIETSAPGRLLALVLAAGLAGPLAAQDAPDAAPEPLSVDPGPRVRARELRRALRPAEPGGRQHHHHDDGRPRSTTGCGRSSPRARRSRTSSATSWTASPASAGSSARTRSARASSSRPTATSSPTTTSSRAPTRSPSSSTRGGELDAELIGRDPRTDIALLKVESETDLPFVEFGDSDAAQVGDWVLAIGNPLGQGFSVSAGIVSARNRTLQGSYDDFIQTDAAINRGNSGGPLFDMEGEVIGVNTAILSPTGGSIGIGFAMSSAVVERVVAQLRDFGETRRGWLGVRIQNVDPDMAEALGLAAPAGALVTDVPEGPALAAGHEGRRRDPALRRRGDRGHPRAGAHRRRDARSAAPSRSWCSATAPSRRSRSRSACSRRRRSPPRPGAPEGEAAPPSEETVLGMTVAAVDRAAARALRALRRRARARGRRGRGRIGRLPSRACAGRRHHRGRPGGGGEPRRHARPHRRRPSRRAATRSCCWSAATARRASSR